MLLAKMMHLLDCGADVDAADGDDADGFLKIMRACHRDTHTHTQTHTHTHTPTSRSKVLCRDVAVKVCSSRAPMSHELSGSPRFWEPQTPFNPQPPNSPNPKHVRDPPIDLELKRSARSKTLSTRLCSAARKQDLPLKVPGSMSPPSSLCNLT